MAVPVNFVDLTGKRVGKLTVVCRAETRNQRIYWQCKCDCGNEKLIVSGSLREGKTQSCGCLHKEVIAKNLRHDLVGKRFGRLVVLSLHGHDKHKQLAWLCKCDCGTEKIVGGGQLRAGDTNSCGCYRRELNTRDNHFQYQPDRKRLLIKYICNKMLQAARRKGETDLSYEDAEDAIFKPCFYCDSVGTNERKDRLKDKMISDVRITYNGLDRIDSSIGYMRSNIVPCCWKCNRAKGTMSQTEFKEHIIVMYKKFGSQA